MADAGGTTETRFDRYQNRRDVSSVPPQGGYVAKRCPLRVQLDVYPPAGATAAEPAPVERLRMDDGIAFEATVFAELVALHPTAVLVDGTQHAAAQEADTLAAMASGAPIVLGGRLPTDLVGRRAGKPDLLVRAERTSAGAWAYHPVDVKHHLTLDVRAPKRPELGAVVAGLADPGHSAATLATDVVLRPHRGDRLQLAHYHRMLEATPHASATAMGAIIGTEQQVVWQPLDKPVLQQQWDRSPSSNESALQRYDFEFAFRLDVLAAAAEGAPIVEPVSISECGSCPWNGWCRPQLLAADSVSFVPGYGYKEWHALRRAGITSRAQLAALDLHSARVRDAYDAITPLTDAYKAAALLPPHAPIADVVGKGAKKRIATFEARGIRTAGDLVALDPAVVALSGQPLRSLADAVHGAQVLAKGGRPELRYGLAQLEVPSAQVEIDIDMENAIDGTAYLWGARLGDTYHPFVSWDRPGPANEAHVFAAFWAWLTDTRRTSAAAGHTVAVYCWYQGAESRALRSGAKAAADHLEMADAPAEVEAFLTGDQFVDLYDVFSTQLITGTSAGLKTVATKAGFAWRDTDPNGADSMAWHAEAVGAEDQATRDAARARLLAYNEDDVRATAVVRAWMRDDLANPEKVTR